MAVVMGQSGAPLYAAASSILDAFAYSGSAQAGNDACAAILWGPVADMGMRRTLYGSRDVFEAGNKNG